MDHGSRRSSRVDRPSIVPPGPRGAEPNTGEPRRFGRHSVEPLSTASSHTVASAYNPDIPPGREGRAATAQTRLSERRTSQRNPAEQFKPEATVRVDLGGGLDNACQRELENVAADSGRNENEQQDANETIKNTSKFIDMIKKGLGKLNKYKGKIAGIAVIVTIGVVGIFIPGVGPVISTVCVVTIVGICTALMFSDGTAVVQPDKKKSSSKTDPKDSDSVSETDDHDSDDDDEDDDDIRSHSGSYSEAGTNPDDNQSGNKKRPLGSRKGEPSALPKGKPKPPGAQAAANAKDEVTAKGNKLKPVEDKPATRTEDEFLKAILDAKGKLKSPRLKPDARTEDELEFLTIKGKLKPPGSQPEDRNQDEPDSLTAKRTLQPPESQSDARTEDEFLKAILDAKGKLKSPGPKPDAHTEDELEFLTVKRKLKSPGSQPEDHDKDEPDSLMAKSKLQPPESQSDARTEDEFLKAILDAKGKLKSPGPKPDAHTEDELEFLTVKRKLKSPGSQPEDHDKDEPDSLTAKSKLQPPESQSDARTEGEFLKAILDAKGKLKSPGSKPDAHTEDELEFLTVKRKLKSPGSQSEDHDKDEPDSLTAKSKLQPPESQSDARTEDEFLKAILDAKGKLKSPGSKPDAHTEDELEFLTVTRKLKSPGSQSEDHNEDEPEFLTVKGKNKSQGAVPDEGKHEHLAFGKAQPSYSVKLSDDDAQEKQLDLVDPSEDEQDLQQDSGYESGHDLLDIKQDADVLGESRSRGTDDSDYGSNYGDESDQDEKLQMHENLAQLHLGESGQENTHNQKLIERSDSGKEEGNPKLTPFQMHIFKHGMDAAGFSDALKNENAKDGTFLGQQEICKIARKELMARNDELIETDVDNWEKVWNALNNPKLR